MRCVREDAFVEKGVMMSDEFSVLNEDEDMAAVKDACAGLMSRFDAVQILATRHTSDEKGSVRVNYGKGNWFARYGLAKFWLLREEQYDKDEQQRDSDL